MRRPCDLWRRDLRSSHRRGLPNVPRRLRLHATDLRCQRHVFGRCVHRGPLRSDEALWTGVSSGHPMPDGHGLFGDWPRIQRLFNAGPTTGRALHVGRGVLGRRLHRLRLRLHRRRPMLLGLVRIGHGAMHRRRRRGSALFKRQPVRFRDLWCRFLRL